MMESTQEEKPKSTPFSSGFEHQNDPERKKLFDAIVAFVGDIRTGYYPYTITLLGSSGIGKTMLANEVYRWAKRNPQLLGYAPYISYLTASGACERYLNGEYNLPELMIREHFLVLDDIGTEHDPRGTFRNRIQQVIDKRIGKWTILTSNLSFTQLQHYDSRMASRLIRGDGKVIHSKATDWNLEKLING